MSKSTNRIRQSVDKEFIELLDEIIRERVKANMDNGKIIKRPRLTLTIAKYFRQNNEALNKVIGAKII